MRPFCTNSLRCKMGEETREDILRIQEPYKGGCEKQTDRHLWYNMFRFVYLIKSKGLARQIVK